MSFCSYDNNYLKEQYTLVENNFINDFMAEASGDSVKVFLYGLYACAGECESFEQFCNNLNMSAQRVTDAIHYWVDLGLIKIVNQQPLELCFVPIKYLNKVVRKFKPEKYAEFNKQLQDIFKTRHIEPNEYLRYYEFVEDYKVQQEALLMVVQYCVNFKGDDVRYPYILTVAKDWANNGAKTVEQVEGKLKEYESNNEAMRLIFKELGKKTAPEFEDKQLYIKWNKNWGYDLESILFATKQCKKRGGMTKLDNLLDSYYKLGIFSLEEMKNYQEIKDKMYKLCIDVNKILGLYYESLDYIVETYIKNWLNFGFDENTLVTLAKYCAKRTIRTLEGMNTVIAKLYSKGIISASGIDEYLRKQVYIDGKIKDIIAATGTERFVTSSDRQFYNIWSCVWGFSDDIILYASTLSQGKINCNSYINQVLSKWKSSGVDTLEKAKNATVNYTSTATNSTATTYTDIGKHYTKEQLDELVPYTDIFDIEV
ncbi:MAG: DnaD domain protein [Clostridia bacterium]